MLKASSKKFDLSPDTDNSTLCSNPEHHGLEISLFVVVNVSSTQYWVKILLTFHLLLNITTY